MAVLNHLLLNHQISILTVTDMQQKWGKAAEKVANDLYKVTRLSEFCNNQKQQHEDEKNCTNSLFRDIHLSEDVKSSILNSFVNAFPDSSLAYELNGRPGINEVVEKSYDSCHVLNEFLDLTIASRRSSTDSLISIEDDQATCDLKAFLKRAFHPDNRSSIDTDIMDFIGPLEINLSVFYEVHVRVSERESLQICLETIGQNSSSMWKEERSRRITASHAYSLYTYYSTGQDKLKDWRRKIMNIVIPKDYQTTAMMHGSYSELPAINAYMRDSGKVVVRCGLVVPPDIPWLGGSPDGIVINEWKIIEVKCPESGKSLPLKDMIPCLKYLTRNQHLLRRNHQYYGQIQMNMFILKCEKTDFLIYSAFEDRCYVQTVLFDERFVRNMLHSLKEVYFNAFLKYLYSSSFKG
ncbi:uncharacterized protein LOC134221967 [Armigeres subalbatus]|uniref:uncharacterized protein LOC134221967 n=1 Tax=Armigeres subalbatus TaxID=124917 RepID=UPI002ED5EB32